MSDTNKTKLSDKGRANPELKTGEAASSDSAPRSAQTPANETNKKPAEFGGQKGLEPTRFGDWEKNGRCTDF